jgi:preprotein translocase subunit SecE
MSEALGLHWYRRTIEFLKEVQAELKRTTWPSWKEVRGTTTVVIITVFLFALYLGVVDLALSSVLQRILQLFSG